MNRAYVIGLGKSGIAAARLLKHQGWQVTLSDRNTSKTLLPKQRALEADGITVKLGDTFTPKSTETASEKVNIQLIVVSPGVPWDLPALQEARSLGIETIGEMELAWRCLQNIPWVGITGTNGKTTTTALTAAIFQKAGLNAPACGNIGYAACELALSETKPDWVIAELSSYQIEAAPSLAPHVGIWTTLTPDHLARHHTLENYAEIKASLLRRSHHQILNGDDPYLRQQGNQHWPKGVWTSVEDSQSLSFSPTASIKNGWVMFKDEPIVPTQSLSMVGDHNQQNLLMAVTTARLAGIEKEAIAQAIATFPGVPHRLERICTWQGVVFINDSKATNYDAAEVGLRAVSGPVILIAGGEAKAGDDGAWLQAIQAQAAAVLLIGTAAPSFAQRLEKVGYGAYEIAETMEKAVSRSGNLAHQHQAQIVLLSPACASFDQYANFEARGDDFRRLCQTHFQD